MNDQVDVRLRELVHASIAKVSPNLDTTKIGLDDDLFVRFLNSLKVVELVIELESGLGCELDVHGAGFERFQTVRNIIAFVKEREVKQN